MIGINFKPRIDSYLKTVRSLIFLPFNIWLYFVSIPIRIVLYAFGGEFWKWNSNKIQTQEFKSINVPYYQNSVSPRGVIESAESIKGEDLGRERKEGEELIARRRKNSSKTQDATSSSALSSRAEIETQTNIGIKEFELLKSEIASYHKRERSLIEENDSFHRSVQEKESETEGLKLEMNDIIRKKQDLSERFYELAEEKTKLENKLIAHEQIEQRMQSTLNKSQKKNFDFQQEIIALKNKLNAKEREIKKFEEMTITPINIKPLTATNQSNESAKPKSKKQKKNKQVQSQKSEKAQAPIEAHSVAWSSVDHKQDFTELVAEAQKEMLEHKPTFSQVISDSLAKEEKLVQKPEQPEFIVIGGEQSSKHVVESESVKEKGLQLESESEQLKSNIEGENKTQVSEKHGWSVSDHKADYTQIVAEAQKEMLEHKQTFSEILSDSIKSDSDSSKAQQSKPEFVIIGGDLSSKHIAETNPVSAI